MENQIKNLPKELKELVKESVALLGEVLIEEEGKSFYKKVEDLRQSMVEYRSSAKLKKLSLLDSGYKDIEKLSAKEKSKLAHAYTLMLELINACEAGYRTFRLRETQKTEFKTRHENNITYVLTAHPTEARTPENIELFRRIQNLTLRILDRTGEKEYMFSIMKHNLKLLWLLPATRHEKPTVKDEANHLFSIILRPDILDTLIRTDRDIGRVRVRTWVGGDKDGHPGVDEVVMLECLQASRNYFYRFLRRMFSLLESDIELLANRKLQESFQVLYGELKVIKTVKTADARSVASLRQKINKLGTQYQRIVGEPSPRVRKINSVFEIFPALVVPIELREDSEIVAESLTSEKPTAIHRMLIQLADITESGGVKNYAQGFILSMCHSYKDIENGIKLVKRVFRKVELPVIPLFETALALEKSDGIVEKLISNKSYIKIVQTKWNGNLEVMLGYSDSSKGMGVLPSRVGIAKTVRKLDLIISNNNLVPVFFHGSGGSIDRGGGNLLDQTAWWPKSALNHYKATIQGEMVERNFTSSEVTMSGVDKILENFTKSKFKHGHMKIDTVVEDFAGRVKDCYTEKISDDEFFKLIESATPYNFLSALKLGSRPAKRKKSTSLDLSAIRAIPWILCWTQIRILFPTWWGIGSSWEQVKKDAKYVGKLKRSFKTSALFSSYVRSLGFTLSKVELEIFEFYLDKSDLSESVKAKYKDEFSREYKNAVNFVKTVTGEKSLLWYRPWLADSIKLRSSMIHPLNLLQIQAFKKDDLDLLRKTVAGISSGMMTTG